MPASLEAIQNELVNIAKDIGEIKHSQKNVQASLDAQRERLTRVEVHMQERSEANNAAFTRAFNLLTAQESRLQKIEIEQPLTQLVRGLAIKMIFGVAAITAIPTGVQVYFSTRADGPRTMVNERTVIERNRTPVEENRTP